MTPQVVVVKIGGSLFMQPHFVSRLQAHVERLRKELGPVHLVFITGGGPLVKSLRAINRINEVSTDQAHWIAIQLMDINAGLLRQWWPQLRSVNSLEELRSCCRQEGMTQFRVVGFLRDAEPVLPGTRLPIGWEVTSDSIAARVAEVLDADQLILVKSTASPATADWNSAAATGVVDAFFPAIAGKLHRVCVNPLQPSGDAP